VLLGQAGPVAVGPLRYDAITRFIRTSHTEEEYGPKKNKLLTLVQDLESKAPPTEGSREVLAKWNVTSGYTLDDLFIANGFLEWIVGHAARSLRPSEFYRLGPFYDEAFPPDERKHLVFRALKEYAAPDSQYVEIVSAFD
jgi:hypothetical protein